MNNKREEVFLIKDITEFGKLMAYCIEQDIVVFRTYWDEREKGKRIYHVNWKERRCNYSDKSWYSDENEQFRRDETLYEIVIPVFKVDAFGRWVIDHCESVDS